MGDGPAPSREVAETQPPSVAPGPSTKSGAATGRWTAETPLASAVLALQASAGNSATVRALARSGLLARTPADAPPPVETPIPELRKLALTDADAVWELRGRYEAMGEEDLKRLARSDALAKQVLAETRWTRSQWTPARDQAGDFDSWEGHKLPHEASGTSLDANGRVMWRGSMSSTRMTPAEKALGFPHSMNATHTEARLVRVAVLPRGGRFTIIGQYDPCVACQIEMRAAAARSGCTIEYWWPGATKGAFVAAPPASTSLTPLTLRAGSALAPPHAVPAATPAPKAGPQQLELALGMKPAPIPRGVTPAPAGGAPALRPVAPSAPSAQLELLMPRTPVPQGSAAAVRGGWGPAAADIALFLIGNAAMGYIRGVIAANEQAMFDATKPEIEARAAALGNQARVRRAELGGNTLWVNVLLVPTYQRLEDTKPGEGGEETSLTNVQIDAVTLGDAYRSGYTQGEPKLINTNGAWVNLYQRHDVLEFSFPFPSDPSAMTRDEIVRRIVETEREARRWSELPQGVRDALAEERAALLQARDALAPPAGVEFVP